MALFAEDILRSRLIGASAVVAYVGARMYPGVAPKGAGFPNITFNRVSSEHHRHLQGAAGLVQVHIQVDMWGDSYLETIGLADAVRHVLDGYRGVVTVGDESVAVLQCSLVEDYTGITGGLDNSARGLFRATHEYEIGHRELVPTLAL